MTDSPCTPIRARWLPLSWLKDKIKTQVFIFFLLSDKNSSWILNEWEAAGKQESD